VVLEDSDMVQRAFDERLGAGFAIFLEQVLLEASCIDPDADRTAVGARGGDDLANPLFGADIAGVDAEAGRAGVGGFERALVVKMDVGDDRNARLADDLLESSGRRRGRAGHADDIGARLLAASDLVDRRTRVFGRGVGHGLDADRRVSANRHGADHDLPRLAPLDVSPGAD
jgi:hypothetical protein